MHFTVFLGIFLIRFAAQADGYANQVPLQDVSAQKKPSCKDFKSYSAIGDSYAAGLGANKRLSLCNLNEPLAAASCTTQACGKNEGSFAYLFWKKYKTASFQFPACTGNNTLSQLNDQVLAPGFGTPDLVTLTAGGNDSSLFSGVVGNCVYVEQNFTREACDQHLARAEELVPKVQGNLAKLFSGIVEKSASNATIVALGYAQFWTTLSSESEAKNCSFLTRNSTGQTSLEQKRRMNKLVVDLNNVIQSAVEEAQKTHSGDDRRFMYGDADSAFDKHRICAKNGSDFFQLAPSSAVGSNGTPYTQDSVCHPNADGQSLYLSVLEGVLGC